MDKNGELEEISGSPFSCQTTLKDVQPPLADRINQNAHSFTFQGSIRVHKGCVFATNYTDRSISVFKIQKDGSLDILGDPVNSGGHHPTSITCHNDYVVVSNDGPSITERGNFRNFLRLFRKDNESSLHYLNLIKMKEN